MGLILGTIVDCFVNAIDVYIFFFFFSSRRRHTRYWRDWSSDVCSSDLRRTTVPRRCARPPLRCRSNSCPCRATAPISCRLRRSGAGCARTSPTATATAPPRISAAASPPPRRSSIRTPAPSLTASGSKIGSTLRRRNYASQGRRGLAAPGDERAGRAQARRPPGGDEVRGEGFLHDGRPLDVVLRRERVPVPDRQVAPLPAVEDAAPPLARGA